MYVTKHPVVYYELHKDAQINVALPSGVTEPLFTIINRGLLECTKLHVKMSMCKTCILLIDHQRATPPVAKRDQMIYNINKQFIFSISSFKSSSIQHDDKAQSALGYTEDTM